MKVLLVNKFHYVKGGSERYYFTLEEAFKRKGHEVVFFSMKDKRNVFSSQEKYFVNNSNKNGRIINKIKLLSHIVYSKEAYKKMRQLLRDEKPDLVILNLVHKQITCSIIDAIKKYNSNLPIFWTMHDLICVCPSYTMLDGRGDICEKCLDGNFNHCITNKCIHNSYVMSCLSTFEAKKIKKKQWYDKVDLFICPSLFYKNILEKSNFTKSKIIYMRNPLPNDTKYECNNNSEEYFLYFGRISKEKGVKTLINCMMNINYKLIILGTGQLENELKKYVLSNCISNVLFKGFIQGQELSNYIKNSRCVVIPSEWYENGPYSAMETMALGKPLIVSNLGGLPELVDNGKTGYIYSNFNELNDSLLKMINLSADEYGLFCQEAVKKSKNIFSPNKYVDDLLKYFEK